jgi:hypothetical protein
LQVVIGGGVIALGLTGAALAYSFGVWPFAAEDLPHAVALAPKVEAPAPAKQAKWETMSDAHPDSPKLLEKALARMHREAVTHFLADPRNGYFRMDPVYEKIVRDWTIPFFSPGELDGAEPVPFKKDLDHIHAGSIKDFLSKAEPKPAVAPRLTLVMSRAEWDKIAKEKKVWEAKQLDLIGLLKSPEPVAYSSEKLADAKKTGRAPVRPLDEFEMIALDALSKGQDMFAHSRDGVIRMVGAVRANTSCLSCHDDKKEGDLLGAFSYTLREAEYRRAGGGRVVDLPDK